MRTLFLTTVFALGAIPTCANAQDTGGYGEVFDKIQTQNAAITNEEKFAKIKPYLNSQGNNICGQEIYRPATATSTISCNEICSPLSDLIAQDYYPAISYAITEALNFTGLIGLCQKSLNYKFVNIDHIHSSGDRVAEVRQSKFDTYSLSRIALNGKNYSKANEYLSISANLGYDKAQYEYGEKLKLSGDDKSAFVSFNKAAEQGNINAIQALKKHFAYDFVPKTPSAIGAQSSLSHSTPSSPSLSNIEPVPSVMAKDYWVVSDSAQVFDNQKNEIDTLNHSQAVTTYGEQEGLGKIDLTQERWVKLSDLSTSKPEPKRVVNNKPASLPKGNRKDTLRLTRYVSGSSLNYRDAPNGNKLGSFPFSTKLTVYDRAGKWVRVSKADASEKWVHEGFIVAQKPAARKAPSQSTNQTSRRLSDAECGRLRIKKVATVKTQSQYDVIERQLTRGGCNSQRDARRRQWDWVTK